MARLSRLVLTLSICAALAAAPAVANAAPGDSYVVKDGDYLLAIASRFDVSLDDLLAANNLTMTSVIHPGQRLQLPGSGGGGGATGAGYTVAAGDTLFGIATRHDVSLSSLLAVNSLAEDSLIMPGMRLRLPSGASAPAAPAAPSGASYTVVAGDTLFGIANRHETSLASLLAANQIGVDTVIHPGTRLRLPSGARAPSAPSAPGPATGPSHTIRSGDTLSGIASTYHVSLESLLSVNGITVDTMIQPGMHLRLPQGARAVAVTGSPVDTVVAFAFAQLGKPYKFFTKGPATFDCSGLTLAGYAQIGIQLVHHSASQATQGRAVDHYHQAIRAGDLVFRRTNGSPTINHVGIAVSSTAWIQARRVGTPIELGPLPPDSEIAAVRRLISG